MANKLETIYHNLSLMLESGVHIVKALRHAGAVTRGRLPRTFNALAEHTAQGESLTSAMAQHRRVFVPLDIQLVQVGEESGNLPLMLKELSGWYALCNRLNRVILSGMTLPFLIFHFVAFFIPAMSYITSMLTDGNVTTSDAVWQMIGILSLLYIPVGTIIFIIQFTPKTGPLRWLLDSIILKIPLVGYAFKQLALSRFCRNFSLCYSAGVPMLRTCQVAMDGAGNVIVGNWFKPTLDKIRDGQAVSQGLPTRKLSPEFLASWENGEEAGKLDMVTDRLANHASERSENRFHQIAIWLPRIVYGLVSIYIIKQIFATFAKAYSGLGI